MVSKTLSVEAIRRQLATTIVGRHVYLFGEVESTNTVLRYLARHGAREGSVVLADSQTHGRGRAGRAWFSPAGVNLYASVLFREPLSPRDAPGFSFIASLALADAIEALGLDPAIKWPNDLLVQQKKVAGSLMECATVGDRIEFLVLGMGVNLNADPESLRAALGPTAAAASSLATFTGRPVDRNAFAASYLNHLDEWARTYRRHGVAPIMAAWRGRDMLTGRRVSVGDGQAVDARVLGVDDEGHLLVRDASGGRRVVLTEAIRVLD